MPPSYTLSGSMDGGGKALLTKEVFWRTRPQKICCCFMLPWLGFDETGLRGHKTRDMGPRRMNNKGQIGVFSVCPTTLCSLQCGFAMAEILYLLQVVILAFGMQGWPLPFAFGLASGGWSRPMRRIAFRQFVVEG
eukprot:6462784-Amphidinium_carterae.5